jgi:hypothetical protein
MRELSLRCRMRRRVAPEAPYHETHGNDAADADEQVSLHFALRLPRRCRKNVTSVGSWLLFHGGDNLEKEASTEAALYCDKRVDHEAGEDHHPSR